MHLQLLGYNAAKSQSWYFCKDIFNCVTGFTNPLGVPLVLLVLCSVILSVYLQFFVTLTNFPTDLDGVHVVQTGQYTAEVIK